jgi:hypothetical protein
MLSGVDLASGRGKILGSFRVDRSPKTDLDDIESNRGEGRYAISYNQYCWGLVLKCYELRTRQQKMSKVKALRPSKHYFP